MTKCVMEQEWMPWSVLVFIFIVYKQKYVFTLKDLSEKFDILSLITSDKTGSLTVNFVSHGK